MRKLARDLGVDLAGRRGSGPGGRATRADVETWAGSAPATTVPEGAVPAPGPTPAPAGTAGERIPVTGIRKAIAEKMVRSRREIPDATSWVDADATELMALRDTINARRAADANAVKVTPLVLVLRACVAALQQYPLLNARFDAEAGEIELRRAVHLGFAAQTDRGLLVPVIHDAQDRTTIEIAGELARLAQAVRDGTATPGELTGGTFTVSNYGAFGVDGGAAVINHPEVAILGVGRIVDRPWVVDGAVAVRKVVQLSLSFDHRVCDGGDAGGFLRFVADCVEQPGILLAHV